ncbi:hypothetical protein [Parasegetibacter sp. NRK P23]|uniref:hypothetical protein n=1 Tax=Parasegetibacter sp. NRK P23 TaxID=2942999 RepID=UPI002043DD65|nr:hypothetical protein [Parasegetibacter sp. NRK P23]MCM5529679.1 hypothetical protein [Parasegetibacter sp. NRK P23]
MKKVLLVLLLLNYINTTMFFPVIEEVNTAVDALGYYDETNSIVELIKKEMFGKKSRHADDEDNDQPLAPALRSITVSAVVLADPLRLLPAFNPSLPTHDPLVEDARVSAGFLSRFSPPPDVVPC